MSMVFMDFKAWCSNIKYFLLGLVWCGTVQNQYNYLFSHDFGKKNNIWLY